MAARVDYASLNGTVLDASRAVVQGARVVAVSSETGLRETSAGGSYQMSGLAIGMYTITISRPGFRAAEFKNVELSVKWV
jgi:hypothetical protein